MTGVSKEDYDELDQYLKKYHDGRSEKIAESAKKITKDNHVSAVYDITGDWNSLVIAYFKDRKDLNGFIKRILTMDYVERSNTQIVLDIVKDEKRVLI